jgi:hypothetical protein
MNISPLAAQGWFNVGYTWVYKYRCCWGFQRGYEEVWVDGDTIINGQACKVLKNQISTVTVLPDPSNDTIVSVGDAYFVYEQSDSVFIYDESEEEFLLIYDFHLDFDYYPIYYIGDWVVGPCLGGITFFQLSDTTSLQIGSQHRRVQNLLVSDIDYAIEAHYISVIEGIGAVKKPPFDNPIPLTGEDFGHIILDYAYPCADGDNRDFCSFTSNEEEYNPNDKDCYGLPMPVAVDDLSIIYSTYNLYPNPVTTHFSIQSDLNLNIKKATIFNSKGSVEKIIHRPNDKIDISNLAASIYILKIEVGAEIIYKKLLKQ